MLQVVLEARRCLSRAVTWQAGVEIRDREVYAHTVCTLDHRAFVRSCRVQRAVCACTVPGERTNAAPVLHAWQAASCAGSWRRELKYSLCATTTRAI
jgi:hypothetical protein